MIFRLAKYQMCNQSMPRQASCFDPDRSVSGWHQLTILLGSQKNSSREIRRRAAPAMRSRLDVQMLQSAR
jgi:hypothetical protein